MASATEQVKERVQDVAEQAKGQTREQLRTQINARSTQAGEQVSSTAEAMRRTSEQLRSEGKDRAAKVIDGVADRGERLGSYLTRADGDQILRDVEDFARKQPWLFVGGSAVAGFLASRFMKASSSSRYQSRAGAASRSSSEIPAERVSRAAWKRRWRCGRRSAEGRCREWPRRERRTAPGERQEQLHEQPIGELLKQLATETTTLVRQELDLAKAEMREKGKKAGPGFGMIGAAGGVALLALGRADRVFHPRVWTASMPNWLAALLVALVYGAVAARALRARQRKGR